MKKSKLFLAGMAALLLLFGLVLAGCPTDGGDDGNGDGGGGKPAALATNATHTQAIEKLDDIIAYAGASSEAGTQAQGLKTAISALSSAWSSVGATYIPQINTLITSLPDDGGGK